jgi:hypothetical protein
METVRMQTAVWAANALLVHVVVLLIFALTSVGVPPDANEAVANCWIWVGWLLVLDALIAYFLHLLRVAEARLGGDEGRRELGSAQTWLALSFAALLGIIFVTLRQPRNCLCGGGGGGDQWIDDDDGSGTQTDTDGADGLMAVPWYMIVLLGTVAVGDLVAAVQLRRLRNAVGAYDLGEMT